MYTLLYLLVVYFRVEHFVHYLVIFLFQRDLGGSGVVYFSENSSTMSKIRLFNTS